MPVRSPRYVYELNITVTAPIDDVPEAIDPAPGQTVGGTFKPIYIKMKKSIGDWLGLTPIPWNSPIFTGTFKAGQTGATNTGSKFRRRIGGFRVASYTLVAVTAFEITEYVKNETTGDYTQVKRKFETISIGFPKGHSVNEIISWLSTTGRGEEIAGVRSPSGTFTPTYYAGNQPAT